MFKSSSTLENYKSTKCVIKRYIDGLVQPVADNFDIDISSLMTQSSINNGSSDEEAETFMRLKKTHIKKQLFQTQPFITTLDQRNRKYPLKKLNLDFSQQK